MFSYQQRVRREKREGDGTGLAPLESKHQQTRLCECILRVCLCVWRPIRIRCFQSPRREREREKKNELANHVRGKHSVPSPPLTRFSSRSVSVHRLLHPPFSFRVSLSGRDHLFQINILLSLRAGAKTQPKGEEEHPRAGGGRKDTLHQGLKTQAKKPPKTITVTPAQEGRELGRGASVETLHVYLLQAVQISPL